LSSEEKEIYMLEKQAKSGSEEVEANLVSTAKM
jgi:hypothetical protein